MIIYFTKVFAEGSILEGTEFKETLKDATKSNLQFYAEHAESGRVIPTGVYGGSDYRIKDVCSVYEAYVSGGRNFIVCG